jgi:predicted HTH domain antitoxin
MDMFVLSLFEVERKTQPDNAVNGKTKTGNPSQNQGINPRHSALFDARQNTRHHDGMLLTLPENREARLSPQSIALHLAIGLFVADESTLGHATQVAGLSQAYFLRELGQRRIPIHYGFNELAADLQAVDEFAGS